MANSCANPHQLQLPQLQQGAADTRLTLVQRKPCRHTTRQEGGCSQPSRLAVHTCGMHWTNIKLNSSINLSIESAQWCGICQMGGTRGGHCSACATPQPNMRST